MPHGVACPMVLHALWCCMPYGVACPMVLHALWHMRNNLFKDLLQLQPNAMHLQGLGSGACDPMPCTCRD